MLAAPPQIFGHWTHCTQENAEARIDLPDQQPGIVARVLEFLYTGNYSVESPSILQVPTEDFSVEASKHQKSSADADHNSSLGDQSPKTPASAHRTLLYRPESSRCCITRLKIHTLVYLLANFWGVINLKLQAFEQFKTSFDGDFVCHPDFESLLSLVLTSTASTDECLRAFVIESTIIEYQLLQRKPQVELVMKSYEPMAWLVGIEFRKSLEVLEEKNRELTQENSRLKRRQSASFFD